MRYSPGCEGVSPLLFKTVNVDSPPGRSRHCSATSQGILTGGENKDVCQPTPGMQLQNSQSQGTAVLVVVSSVLGAALSSGAGMRLSGGPVRRVCAHPQIE